jgi:hypothetical protein
MGYPLRLRDGSVALLELRSGARLSPDEEEVMRDYVEFLRDRSDAITLARKKLAAPPTLPVNTDFIRGGPHAVRPPELAE